MAPSARADPRAGCLRVPVRLGVIRRSIPARWAVGPRRWSRLPESHGRDITPISLHSLRLMVSPRPLPCPGFPLLWTWENSSEIASSWSGGILIPVSLTDSSVRHRIVLSRARVGCRVECYSPQPPGTCGTERPDVEARPSAATTVPRSHGLVSRAETFFLSISSVAVCYCGCVTYVFSIGRKRFKGEPVKRF